MNRSSFRRAAIWVALFASQVEAVTQVRDGLGSAAEPTAIHEAASRSALPGARAGTERWIVHFAARRFDLNGLRSAVLARRSAAEIASIVAGLESAVIADQASFAEAARALGARVAQQWWIVNAAAVEIEPARLAAVRALPNVAFLEPDREARAWIRTATNASNHNADLVQSQGHRGLGVAVGVMDSGQDSDMNGIGRPHRMYFVNGDPNNASGGGLGGSRLVVNRQIGLQIADDRTGHGTAVASVAAGANWGPAAADDGHAPLAQIAGYAIANSATSGASSEATIVSAWQSLVADRVAFDIAVANLSYGGTPDPLNVMQQALDAAAWNADILICVAAGNNGLNPNSTSSSQGAANGLAVAALAPNVHTVAPFSSRGPLVGDTARFYPDIAACGVSTVMAARDDEGITYTDSGTSMASPQVAGAAAQLRGRFTALSALETKAILLASTLDLAAQNPGLTRNEFGMGLLKNDRAHAIAAANQHGSAVLSAGTPSHTFAIPAVQGRSYAIAIAWHRQDTTSNIWSNLDLEVLDATGARIASSSTTRNLYEMVRTFQPYAGPLTVRTTGVSLSAATQPFAWAWTEQPTVPFRGSAVSYGQGCPGSVLTPPQCTSLNASGGTLVDLTLPNEVAYDLVAPSQLLVSAFEIFSRSNTGSAVTASAGIYALSGNAPSRTPLSITTVTIGPTAGFYRGSFASSVRLPAGPFWIGLDQAGTTLISNLTTGTQGGAYFRSGFASSTAWSRLAWVLYPSIRVFCPQVPATPALSASGTPTLGASFSLGLSLGAPSVPALLELGISDQSWNGIPLPLSFAPLGASGCSLVTSIELGLGLVLDAQGAAAQSFSVPNQASWLGARIFAQGLVADTQANALGLVGSNGLRLSLGN